jgi:hypothetical protein
MNDEVNDPGTATTRIVNGNTGHLLGAEASNASRVMIDGVEYGFIPEFGIGRTDDRRPATADWRSPVGFTRPEARSGAAVLGEFSQS